MEDCVCCGLWAGGHWSWVLPGPEPRRPGTNCSSQATTRSKRSTWSSTVSTSLSYTPTAVKFQTHEYRPRGVDPPQEGIGPGDNNMLLYLEMTDHAAFPSDAILPYSGNLVAAGMSGTMLISQQNFWTRYLLRDTEPLILADLNQATWPYVASTNLATMFPEYDIRLGASSHGNAFFAWVEDPASSDGNTQCWNWHWAPVHNSRYHPPSPKKEYERKEGRKNPKSVDETVKQQPRPRKPMHGRGF
ncbi:uncharacterized protein DSM5745_01547 [Aspergillus mulundensis]|uniref:Uncharacterized protein n=1 Tax=Aspergillus mulundensis TaxID=1810919 RepID=A0A3D8T6Q1_9EURO|nr:hypothetical protein DSM5745_01547 [Aspergillus mulundensis]RDW94225.1 hypothetical protein DSM5745_01547 [Aspergillus mulundensis]